MLGRSALLTGALALCAAAESFKPTKIHNVTVSLEKGKFVPNNTVADAGDIVQFHFYPTNHSVVQASFGNPCVPIQNNQKDAPGFYSGHFVITDPSQPPPTWNLTINDTNPIYYYCTAVDSCIGEGMVGAINAPDLAHVQTQFDDARQAPFMLEPGQMSPNSATSSSSSAPASTPTSAPSPSSSPAPSTHSGLPGGAIAGIVIGAIVIVALLVAVFWLLGRHRGMTTGAGGASSSGFGPRSQADRTEQWAATSAGAPSDGATMRGSEMGYAPVRSPYNEVQTPVQGGYSQQGAWASHNHSASATASGAPVMSPTVRDVHHEPMELSANEVTELEAPHLLKS